MIKSLIIYAFFLGVVLGVKLEHKEKQLAVLNEKLGEDVEVMFACQTCKCNFEYAEDHGINVEERTLQYHNTDHGQNIDELHLPKKGISCSRCQVSLRKPHEISKPISAVYGHLRKKGCLIMKVSKKFIPEGEQDQILDWLEGQGKGRDLPKFCRETYPGALNLIRVSETDFKDDERFVRAVH